MCQSQSDESKIEKNYKHLLHLFSKLNISSENLVRLKIKFKNDIDSPRRFEKIQSLEELLKVLHTRFMVSRFQTNILYDILKTLKINNEAIGSRLNYHAKLVGQCQREKSSSELLRADCPTEIVPPQVVDYLSCRLATIWKKFVRDLPIIISEKDIDTVDRMEVRMEEKLKQILHKYLPYLENPTQVLLDCLIKYDRNDLRSDVLKLILENHNGS